MSVLNFAGESDGLMQDGGTDIFIIGRPSRMVYKDGLLAIIQSLTPLQPTSVEWEKNPQHTVSDVDRARVTCTLKSFRTEGWDEQTQFFGQASNPAQSSMVQQSVGRRTFVLSLRCEVFDYNAEAGEILDAVRTQLYLDATSSALNTIGLAFQTCELLTDLPTTYDNRVVNVAVLDIHMAALAQVSSIQIGQGWVDFVDDIGFEFDIIDGVFSGG